MRAVVEAAAWRTQLTERGLQSSAAFEAWLAADPDHDAAWAETQATWEFVDEMATSPEMINARREALARAQRRNQPRWRWTRLPGLRIAAALFAVVVLVGAGGGVAWLRAQPQSYQTALGERRVIPLADGSTVSLDSQSRLKVRFTRDARRLELVSGQARFDVAHDRARPFSVTARDQTIIATGTAFNVDMMGERVLVTLIEGRVVVVDAAKRRTALSGGAAPSRPEPNTVLVAGQQLVVAPAAPPIVAQVNLNRTTAWESGQLIFDDEPIEAVAARVSRYTERPISVDPAAANLLVSGVFKAGDTRTFLDAVTSFLPVDVTVTTDGETVLRRRG